MEIRESRIWDRPVRYSDQLFKSEPVLSALVAQVESWMLWVVMEAAILPCGPLSCHVPSAGSGACRHLHEGDRRRQEPVSNDTLGTFL